jgi:NAD(P)-dependent dehydrogenase (short-subunit alcohol dehydrogenase family)
LADKGIRVNAVLPGPIWTPFTPAGMSGDEFTAFGAHVLMGDPGSRPNSPRPT